MVRRAFIAASRAVFKGLYRAFRKEEREDMVVFLSRQTNEPSYDYSQLESEFTSRGWLCVMHLKKVRGRNIVAYVGHVVKELKLLGRCKMAILDRYDPVISLIDFECYERPAAPGTCANLEFPRKPIVLQIWHAFGAFKKFGFQSIDTPEGHSADFTDAYDIHRNYSWVLCSGEGARAAFAEAFSCPPERVVPLARPEYDELLAARNERRAHVRAENERLTVLMAPTLRINGESAHPFRDLYADRADFEAGVDADFEWSFHPLESGLPAPGNASQSLLRTDCLVTDYSSIAYEAALLEIPVFFYMPDIDSYRISPGLNADPTALCPDICAFDRESLGRKLASLATGETPYPFESLSVFAATGFDPEMENLTGTAASRIADFAIGKCHGA